MPETSQNPSAAKRRARIHPLQRDKPESIRCIGSKATFILSPKASIYFNSSISCKRAVACKFCKFDHEIFYQNLRCPAKAQSCRMKDLRC